MTNPGEEFTAAWLTLVGPIATAAPIPITVTAHRKAPRMDHMLGLGSAVDTQARVRVSIKTVSRFGNGEYQRRLRNHPNADSAAW